MDNYGDKSYWLDVYGPYEPNPALEGEQRTNVAIIGGGFTGLSTAYNMRKADPGLEVVVLEAEVIGFGASGRNGGFSMTLFGLEPAVTKMLFGHQRTVEAHHYMERAVDYVDVLVREHQIESDYWFPGFLRAATTPGYVKRIQKDLELLTSMGITGIEWIEATQIREEVDSPLFLGGWWEPRCGLLDPVKQARELKRLAEEAGARIYEHSPVEVVERGTHFKLMTPGGSLLADKIVFATNAYSLLFSEIRRKQIPAFTHMVVTEPLSESQLGAIGWKNRQGIEDARNLVHYFRLTIDNRLVMGGSDVSIAYGGDMEHDMNRRIFADLKRDVVRLFPVLEGIKFTHHWGGPVSVPVDMAPAIGYVGDERAVYSLGYVGHGVSLAHLNGVTITDLLLERQSDLTDTWFVNRRMIPWPPEPFRFMLSHAIRGYLRIEDAIYERNLEG